MIVPAASASPVAQADTLWSEDWEGDFTDNWFVDGGTWEVGAPASGPGSAYRGENVGATVLNGNYSDGAPDSRLVRLTAFTIPDASEDPRLRFSHWFSFHGAGSEENSDFGRVEVSIDGGDTWEAVSPIYSGNSSAAWSFASVDLSPYAGQEVQVAFFFHSLDCCFGDDGGPGWYIDEVSLISTPLALDNPEGWESGIGDWAAERGTWEIGAPTSGPAGAYSGENVAATSLAGNYYDGASDSRLISPSFVVPDSSESPRLRFWHWFSFHGAGSGENADFGRVEISADGGDTWEAISNLFTGSSSNSWTFFSTLPNDLLSYVGQEVQVAFFFHSLDCCFGSDGAPGWYIDEVEIEGLGDPTTTDPEVERTSFVLHGAYPNPSASVTEIAVELAKPADVTLHVFDVLGREVTAPMARTLAVGKHRILWEPPPLSSGVYLYRVEARMSGRTESRSGRFTLIE